jgi:DNA-binding NarL/FixJ family response regulator
MTTVLIVEDHVFTRRGLGRFLEAQGLKVLEAGDEATALALASQHRPEAAIVDIVIPEAPGGPERPTSAKGLRLARRLKEAWPALGVLLLSSHADRGREFLDLIDAGHRGLGYVLKSGAPEAVLTALYEVMNGRVMFDPQVRSRRQLAEELIQRLSPEERPWVERALHLLPTLSAREWEVVRLTAMSYDGRGIAERLNVQPKTVEHYTSVIYDKLGLGEMPRQAPRLRQAHLLAKICLISDLQQDHLP